MNILIAAATATELGTWGSTAPSAGQVFALDSSTHHRIDVLVTGVGVAATTFHLTQHASKYDIVVNIGIAGSYSSSLPIGSVVCVQFDTFADYGIDSNGVFIPLSKAGLAPPPDFMENKWTVASPYSYELATVRGITVGTASGSTWAIDRNVERWNPDIETMEGAAIFYVCNALNKPFICIRAISNMVEPRNTSRWNIPLAVERLYSETKKYIGAIGKMDNVSQVQQGGCCRQFGGHKTDHEPKA